MPDVVPSDAALLAASGRVTDAIVHLIATGQEESADLLEGQAMDCRSLADWTALADIAADALRSATDNLRKLEVTA